MYTSLTLVVPVYNEAASLPTTMPALVAYCQRANRQLIVVNDGSTDATKALLSAYEKQDRVTVLHHKPTVCLDVIALVASSCGQDSGQIEQLVAQ